MTIGQVTRWYTKLERRCSCSKRSFITLIIFICISLILLINGINWFESEYPCITPLENRTRLVYMVKAFTEIMTELNVTHWVDYGTLLGAVRYENISIWDYDADVSFDRKFVKLLHNGGIAQKIAKERYNMHLNAAVILYEGMQTDIYSWKKRTDDYGGFIYTKATHRGPDLVESQFNDFNASFIEETVLIPFAGGFVRAPYPPKEFLKRRYPTSYKRTVPFKTSCYFPWNIPHWFIYNRPIHTID